MHRLLRAASLFFLLAWGAVPARAAPAQDVEGWREESAVVAARLDRLERRVVQADTALRRADHELGVALMAAMLESDPGLVALAERLPALEAQGQIAHQVGDEASARALERRIMEIRARYLSAQRAALRQPRLAARIKAFDALVRRRMQEADSDAGRLWARFHALEERIAGAAPD